MLYSTHKVGNLEVLQKWHKAEMPQLVELQRQVDPPAEGGKLEVLQKLHKAQMPQPVEP